MKSILVNIFITILICEYYKKKIVKLTSDLNEITYDSIKKFIQDRLQKKPDRM